MISIIICSRDKTQLSKVEASIAATIGVPHEIIAIDNSQGQYGICRAYNVGAAQSQYNILCFAHEDLKFYTHGWGQVLGRLFQDASIGAVGVAGTTYLPDVPAPWWAAGEKYNRMNVVHTTKTLDQELYNINPNQETLADVVALDGLWIATRKAIWEKAPFDSTILTEFHCYDMDYCLNLYKQYRVCVTYEILMEHFSHGSLNSSWIKNAVKLYNKRKEILPTSTVTVSKLEAARLKFGALDYLIQTMRDNKFKKSYTLKYIGKWFFTKPLADITRDDFWKLRFFLGITR